MTSLFRICFLSQRFFKLLCCVVLVNLASVEPASAKVVGPSTFCETYPDVADCLGQLPTCSLCHESTSPPAWNAFGTDVFDALIAHGITAGTGYNFDDHYQLYLPAVLPTLDDVDSDCDGVSNYDEFLLGTNPGVAQSVWVAPPTPGGLTNPWYSVGQYDFKFAFRRVSTVFCGKSATYEEVIAFLEGANPTTSEGKTLLNTRIDARLDSCLQGTYWRKNALRSMADKRIRPLKVASMESSICLILADYEWDYRLWEWIMTEDRNMQELLTAQYHVDETDEGQLVQVGLPSEPLGGIVLPDVLDPALPESYCPNDPTGTILKYQYPFGPGQPLLPEHRAGMVTTQWFLMIHTMFSAMPRTTAAQAARSYLGFDIAHNQGLNPVSDEPLDVDNKGVDQAPCSYCHSTLDPLSYAFAYYNGIAGPAETGNYSEYRPAFLMPEWDFENPPQSVVLGTPVVDLVHWAQVAANSDEFIRNMGQALFHFVLDRDPTPDEAVDFNALWQALPSDGYSANQFLHNLVDLNAFGAP
jgi:hypothetical protein